MKNNCRYTRGSFTVEASIAMVCLIFFILFLMSYIGGLYTESLVEESLFESSQIIRAKLPLLTSVEKLDVIDEVLFRQLLKNEFEKSFEKRTSQREVFKLGIKDLNVDTSKSAYFSDNPGKMKMTVAIEWQMIFLESSQVDIERTLYCDRLPEFFHVELPILESDNKSEIVYLSDHRSVYHTNPNCYHLNDSKTPVELKSLNKTKRECMHCAKGRKNDIQ